MIFAGVSIGYLFTKQPLLCLPALLCLLFLLFSYFACIFLKVFCQYLVFFQISDITYTVIGQWFIFLDFWFLFNRWLKWIFLIQSFLLILNLLYEFSDICQRIMLSFFVLFAFRTINVGMLLTC